MFFRLALPHYEDKTFENFMLEAIDFRTNRPIEIENGPSNDKKKNQYYLEMANEKYLYGFYDMALRYYSLTLKENPMQVDAWVGQIRVLVDCGETETAVFWVERGISQFPDSENLELAKAYALVHAGKIEQAKKLVNKPVKKKESPKFWLFRGEILIKLKIGFFQRLIKPYRSIGKIGAFFCFLKALEPDPRDRFINQRIGIAYLMANDIVRAYGHLRTSLNAAPQNPLTLYCLAECCRRNGSRQNALYYTKKAISLNPKLDAAFDLLVRLHSPYEKFFLKIKKMIRREKI